LELLTLGEYDGTPTLPAAEAFGRFQVFVGWHGGGK
jgi:hypothetical protein